MAPTTSLTESCDTFIEFVDDAKQPIAVADEPESIVVVGLPSTTNPLTTNGSPSPVEKIPDVR